MNTSTLKKAEETVGLVIAGCIIGVLAAVTLVACIAGRPIAWLIEATPRTQKLIVRGAHVVFWLAVGYGLLWLFLWAGGKCLGI